MNNYCRNCGEKLDNDIKVCPKCETEVFEKRINIEQKKAELEEYKKKENRYIIIVIVLYILTYLNFLGGYIFIYISPLLFLGAIITLIYARITMNKSEKIRMLFNFFMTLTILSLLSLLFAYNACSNFINKGCFF